ncbi:DUF1080 domain-containing protein [Catenovulum maritimum]|nr:DUF1080 domain-containing protein [Catenovulum maritimum]
MKIFISKMLIASTALILSSCASTDKTILSTSLSNWQNISTFGNATLVNDEIHLVSKNNWFYLTKKQYKDFILEAEVMLPKLENEEPNSGIIFRGQIGTENNKKFAYGYQAEVDPTDRKWSGGLYEQSTPRQWLHPIHPKRSKPDSDFKQNLSPEWTNEKANALKRMDWNKYVIQAKGPELKIWLNGVLTTHVIDTKFAQGYIGIQHHGNRIKTDPTYAIKFRNIKITEL